MENWDFNDLYKLHQTQSNSGTVPQGNPPGYGGNQPIPVDQGNTYFDQYPSQQWSSPTQGAQGFDFQQPGQWQNQIYMDTQGQLWSQPAGMSSSAPGSMSMAVQGQGSGSSQPSTFQTPQPQQRPMSRAELLLFASQHISQSSWCRNNQPEPPVHPSEQLAQMKIVSPGTSRLDIFVAPHEGYFRCVFPEGSSGNGEPCGYTNLRRARIRNHVASHFNYAPCECGGSCGKPNCSLRYPDQNLLNEHVQRVTKPRTTCEICNAKVTPQNYRRHLQLVHPTYETSEE